MNVTVITHYAQDDPDCDGDYRAVTILVENVQVAEYGDYYHDKGRERAAGFIDGLTYACPSVTVTHSEHADWDY